MDDCIAIVRLIDLDTNETINVKIIDTFILNNVNYFLAAPETPTAGKNTIRLLKVIFDGANESVSPLEDEEFNTVTNYLNKRYSQNTH